MNIKIEMLRYFCTVAQTGNLADAADRLGRTQSAISMMLKQLEGQIGSPLFESERKNRLSPLGEQVFALGSRQVRHFDSTVQAIKDSASAPQGMLRIVSVPSVAALVYPPVVDFLATRHPGLRVELRDTDTQQVIDALVQGWADIGIASTHHILNGVEAVPLFKDQFGLVCAADNPLALRGDDLTIDDVLSAPFLRNALCDHIETAKFRERLERVHVLVHNTHSLLAMVRTGKWVTVLPKSVVGIAPDDLCFQQISDLPDERQAYLYLREQGHLGGIAREVQAFITKQDWIAG